MLAGINLQPGAWDPTEGALDDVEISDTTMRNVATPFHFSMKGNNTAGRIRVDRVTASGVYRSAASVESWSKTPFEHVSFRDVTIEYDGGGTIDQAKQPVKSPGVDARPLPAWGFYFRNVKYAALEDVRLRLAKEDHRPVLIADTLEKLLLDGFEYDSSVKGVEPFVLTHVSQMERRDKRQEISP
jgi:hypothetical protein